GAGADRAQEPAEGRRVGCARDRDHARPHAAPDRRQDRLCDPAGQTSEGFVIARLEGVVIEKAPPHVVIDCNGVGYDVICSGYTMTELPPDGERVTLRVFTHATENKLSLFGFIDLQERQLFDLLIAVKNVGPSTAIAI